MAIFDDYDDQMAFLAREFPGVKTYVDGGEFVVEDVGDQPTIAFLDVEGKGRVKITLVDGSSRVVDWAAAEPD